MKSKKVPMPENWKSPLSDKAVALLEAQGDVREFWEEDGRVVEVWPGDEDMPPGYRRVPMPENWVSPVSDDAIARREAVGGIREFWERINANGELVIEESWLMRE